MAFYGLIFLAIFSRNEVEMSVYSHARGIGDLPSVSEKKSIPFDRKIKMDGLKFLGRLVDNSVPAAFFDPQYRGVMDKLKYGNEGSRQQLRAQMKQMPEETIFDFVSEIARVLCPSGHLFLWIDKFHLCEGTSSWFDGTPMKTVDLITWDKERIGMGYRSRRKAEYLLVAQKKPVRAKGVWTNHSIPDVYQEKFQRDMSFAHPKPIGLQAKLIDAVTNSGDVVIDPAAGSFSVLAAAQQTGRKFLGCDIALGEFEWS
ncbi:DNA methylase [Nitrosococcus oceani AFC27]|nr:DNA methylase [Nitrosococcus oceani AFC27]